MDTPRTRALGLCAALLAACQGHPVGDAPAADACPNPVRHPALLKRIQGTWQVRHTHYERGQKPPTLAPVGELAIDGCRFTFTAREGAEFGQLDRWLPFVRRTRGVVELVDAPPFDATAPRDILLGTLRLRSDPAADDEAPASVELKLLERIQEGEFLRMTTTGDEPSHTFGIARGRLTARGDEYPGGMDPESRWTPPDPQQMREQDARWRREAAARAGLRASP